MFTNTTKSATAPAPPPPAPVPPATPTTTTTKTAATIQYYKLGSNSHIMNIFGLATAPTTNSLLHTHCRVHQHHHTWPNNIMNISCLCEQKCVCATAATTTTAAAQPPTTAITAAVTVTKHCKPCNCSHTMQITCPTTQMFVFTNTTTSATAAAAAAPPPPPPAPPAPAPPATPTTTTTAATIQYYKLGSCSHIMNIIGLATAPTTNSLLHTL